jgi:hypothetical protein
MDVINCYKSETAQMQAAKDREAFWVSLVGIIGFIVVILLFIFGKAW